MTQGESLHMKDNNQCECRCGSQTCSQVLPTQWHDSFFRILQLPSIGMLAMVLLVCRRASLVQGRGKLDNPRFSSTHPSPWTSPSLSVLTTSPLLSFSYTMATTLTWTSIPFTQRVQIASELDSLPPCSTPPACSQSALSKMRQNVLIQEPACPVSAAPGSLP